MTLYIAKTSSRKAGAIGIMGTESRVYEIEAPNRDAATMKAIRLAHAEGLEHTLIHELWHRFPSNERHFRGICDENGHTVYLTADGMEARAGRHIIARYNSASKMMESPNYYGPPSALAADEFRLTVRGGPDKEGRQPFDMEWADEHSGRSRGQSFHGFVNEHLDKWLSNGKRRVD